MLPTTLTLTQRWPNDCFLSGTGVCWKQSLIFIILNILYIVWLNLIIWNVLYADTKQLCMSQLSSKKSRTSKWPTTTTNRWINIWCSGSYFIRKYRFASQTLWRINYLYNIFMNMINSKHFSLRRLVSLKACNFSIDFLQTNFIIAETHRIKFMPPT